MDFPVHGSGLNPFEDWVSETSDSDNKCFFGIGMEDVDEGFCDSDDNAGLPNANGDQVPEASKKACQPDDIDHGYGDFPGFFDQPVSNGDLAVLGTVSTANEFTSADANFVSSSTGSSSDWCGELLKDLNIDHLGRSVFDNILTSPICSPPSVRVEPSTANNYLPVPNCDPNVPVNHIPLGSGPRGGVNVSLPSSSTSEATATASNHTVLNESIIPGLTEDELIEIPFTKLKIIAKQNSISDDVLRRAKEIRKRGKNKQAARTCRERKMTTICTLGDEVKHLKSQLSNMTLEKERIKRELQIWKNRCIALERQTQTGPLFNNSFHQ